MRKQIGLFVLGVVATVAIGLWIARLAPKEAGDYAVVSLIEHADGRLEVVSDSNARDAATCEEEQRIAKAFLQQHPDVRTVGLACVRIVRNVTGGAR